MGQILQVVGIALLLAAFAAVQFQRLHLHATPSLVANVSGASILAIGALLEDQWLVVLGAVTWVLVSLVARRPSTKV